MRPILFIAAIAATLCSCQPKSTGQKLEQAAQKENQRCPQAIAPNIRIDSVTYSIAHNKLTYYYALSEELDNLELIAANHDLLQLQLEEAIESEAALLPYRNHGATISYQYYSQKSKKPLAQFTVEGAK
ncbi:MAG: hypothetical protein ACRCUJ_03110 [Phocaeicola sp.]